MKFLVIVILIILGFAFYALLSSPNKPSEKPNKASGTEIISSGSQEKAQASKQADDKKAKELAENKKELDARIEQFKKETKNVSISKPVNSFAKAMLNSMNSKKFLFLECSNDKCPRCLRLKMNFKKDRIKLPEKFFQYARIDEANHKASQPWVNYFRISGTIHLPVIYILDNNANILGKMSGGGQAEDYNKFILDSYKKGVALELNREKSIFSTSLPNVSPSKPVKDLNKAMNLAKSKNKMLFLILTQKKCERCKIFKQYVKYKKVKIPEKYFIFDEIDGTDRGRLQKFANRFKFSQSVRVPYVFIVSPEGQILASKADCRSVDEYNNLISAAYKKWKK